MHTLEILENELDKGVDNIIMGIPGMIIVNSSFFIPHGLTYIKTHLLFLKCSYIHSSDIISICVLGVSFGLIPEVFIDQFYCMAQGTLMYSIIRKVFLTVTCRSLKASIYIPFQG